MHFREKTAWLTLACMAIAYCIYFAAIISGHPAGREPIPMLWLFGTIASLQALAVAAGTILFAVSGPKEARQRADERDRAISNRAGHAGYYVLLVGLILVGVVMPFTDSGMKVVNSALFVLVIAEAVRGIVILTSYRAGWRG